MSTSSWIHYVKSPQRLIERIPNCGPSPQLDLDDDNLQRKRLNGRFSQSSGFTSTGFLKSYCAFSKVYKLRRAPWYSRTVSHAADATQQPSGTTNATDPFADYGESCNSIRDRLSLTGYQHPAHEVIRRAFVYQLTYRAAGRPHNSRYFKPKISKRHNDAPLIPHGWRL